MSASLSRSASTSSGSSGSSVDTLVDSSSPSFYYEDEMAKLDVAGLLRYSKAIHDYTSQQWQQTRNVLEQQARTKAGSSSSSGRKSILKKSARP